MTNVIVGTTLNASTKRNQLRLKKLINYTSMDLAVLQEELMNFYHNVSLLLLFQSIMPCYIYFPG